MAPRILTLANQKGGVGKTTTAINLATALAAIGERVLIVDLDPQGNASTGPRHRSRAGRDVSSYDLLIGEASVAQASMMTSVPNVAIVPSTLDLLGVELTIAQQADRAFRLRDAFRAMGDFRIEDRPVSYVLIDCPPSLNLLTINALVAADAVLVPLQCEFFALEGLSQLLQTIEQIRSTLNPRLSIQGVVMTMFDKRNNLSRAGACRRAQRDGRRWSMTPSSRAMSGCREAPSYGKPALLYDLKCAGSQAYLRLATEVIRRERQLVAA